MVRVRVGTERVRGWKGGGYKGAGQHIHNLKII